MKEVIPRNLGVFHITETLEGSSLKSEKIQICAGVDGYSSIGFYYWCGAR